MAPLVPVSVNPRRWIWGICGDFVDPTKDIGDQSRHQFPLQVKLFLVIVPFFTIFIPRNCNGDVTTIATYSMGESLTVLTRLVKEELQKHNLLFEGMMCFLYLFHRGVVENL